MSGGGGGVFVIATGSTGRVVRNGLGSVILFPSRELAESELAKLIKEDNDWARFGVFGTYVWEEVSA